MQARVLQCNKQPLIGSAMYTTIIIIIAKSHVENNYHRVTNNIITLFTVILKLVHSLWSLSSVKKVVESAYATDV